LFNEKERSMINYVTIEDEIISLDDCKMIKIEKENTYSLAYQLEHTIYIIPVESDNGKIITEYILNKEK
jgi:hypothetical protein